MLKIQEKDPQQQMLGIKCVWVTVKEQKPYVLIFPSHVYI